MSIISKTGVGLHHPIYIKWRENQIKTFVKSVSFATQNIPNIASIHTFGSLSWQDPVFHEDPADLFESPGVDQVTLFILLNDSIEPFVSFSMLNAQTEFEYRTPKSQLVACGEMFDLRNPSRKLIFEGVHITGVDMDKKMVQVGVDFMH